MAFQSILFKNEQYRLKNEMPGFFTDLNLDQIVNTITAQKDAYNLKPFFYTQLSNVDEIKYRQEVMQDIENEELFSCIKSFAEKMHTMRQYLIYKDKLSYRYQKERWFLDAVGVYCDAVRTLAHALSNLDLKSEGFVQFKEYLRNYVDSKHFETLSEQTEKLESDLSEIKYSIFIKENKVRVQKYESEKNYADEVLETFEKFKQGSTKDYRISFDETIDMNHVEGKILEFVAQLYADTFSELDTYCVQNANYMDKVISRLDREIQFYVSYLEYITPLKKLGLNFCYPEISTSKDEIYDHGGFDLALAHKLADENSRVVCNDFYLKGKERIFVVTGPNQGGKTTFARTFGQLHYLSKIGCPVPGSEAKLFHYDEIFTHFEREEHINSLRGKLEDDLVRIQRILNRATPNSIIIMNEIFSSTTLEDALFLGKKILEEITKLDSLAILVTFMDELSRLNEKVVSMVSTVVPEKPEIRTYKILRKPSNGLSYAISLAKKHRLTYDQLKERIKE